MAINNQVATFDTLRSIAFGSISGTYAAIGTALTEPAHIIKIVNTCNTDMLISVDGSTDADIIPASNFVLYDVSSDSFGDVPFAFPKGMRFYVKQVSAPASGNVYLTVVYGRS